MFQRGGMKQYKHGFIFSRSLLLNRLEAQSSKAKLLLPIMPIGIVPYAFTLSWDNHCRNSCKSYQDPISKGEKKYKEEVELCEKADFVVGVGPKLCEAFRRYLRWCKKDETTLDITPGVFDEFMNVEHASEERERCGILVFGCGDAEDFQLKGFDVAGKAVAVLNDAQLVFVGAPEGKYEDIAKRLLECGLPAHRLTVRSFLQSREDLKRLFCEVDVVLMPSRTEGFGLAGLEALSAVLVSRNSGFGEALRKVPFGSACLIDSEDPLVWAEAIKEVWNKDRETRLQEAELLRSSYEKKYSWAKQSEGLVNQMLTLVNGMYLWGIFEEYLYSFIKIKG